VDSPECHLECDPTDVGKEVVSQLQSWVYGSAENSSITLGASVLSGTYEEAEFAKDLCVASLLDCISTSTCFSLLTLAESVKCSPLYEAAERYSLQHFEEAIDKDVAGLKLLNEQQITRLLTSDDLVLSSEYQAFIGLSAWVEADLPERLSRLADLMRDCIRFNHLTMAELTQVLDHSQLVALDPRALELGAQAVIQYYMASDMFASMNGIGFNRKPRVHLSTETDRTTVAATTAAGSPPSAMRLSAALRSGRLELVSEEDRSLETILDSFAASVDLNGKKTRPRSAKMEATTAQLSLTQMQEQSPSKTMVHAIAVAASACPERTENDASDAEILPARRALF
jgi:BTB And C-terminal Kelch